MGLEEALQASWVCPQRELMAKAAVGGVLRGRELTGPLPGLAQSQGLSQKNTTSHPDLRRVLKG